MIAPALDRDWLDAIALWLIVLRATGARPKTIALRRYQLTRVGRELGIGPWAVTGEQLLMWVGSQVGWGSRDTLRSYRSALRSFYGWARESGRVSIDPSRALPKVRPEEPNPRPTPEIAYREALRRAGARERLMLRLAGELGMRRGEVAVAHADDLERDLFGWSMIVHGKGGKVRRVPVPAGLAGEIRRRTSINGGYLFPGKVDGHLSAHWVGKLVARLLPGVWAMHSLRHRFGTSAYGQERDITVVQELLGHSSLDTTRRYVKVPAESLRRTVEAVGRL